MNFDTHNHSWAYGPDPAEAFEGVRAKAQWAENHGFVWFSVMDHLIQIGGVGAPDQPFLEGWTVLSGPGAVTNRIRLATLATSVGYRNPAHLAKIASGVDLISRGRLTSVSAPAISTRNTANTAGNSRRARRCVFDRWRRLSA
jgi:alkanesulfonate monooxygenase SsuD/methylene tetrahydromethanopterin reductase-like flavin-dependent oxidoreductase (luciferase family)